MKKLILALFVASVAWGAIDPYRAPLRIDPKETVSPKQSHLYLRLNVTEPNPGNRRPIVPGLGLGYRKVSGSSALDFSAGYSQRRHHGKTEYITLPKMSYLYYFAPIETQSLYIGPGIAYGRIKNKGKSRFEGFIPSATLGYEITRRSNMLTFLQLDMSVPVLGTKMRGPLPGLIAEFAFGAGF